MNRMFAIIEREMRKFFRSPTLMVTAMIFPLVQLIILGNAFGGKIRDGQCRIINMMKRHHHGAYTTGPPRLAALLMTAPMTSGRVRRITCR